MSIQPELRLRAVLAGVVPGCYIPAMGIPAVYTGGLQEAFNVVKAWAEGLCPSFIRE